MRDWCIRNTPHSEITTTAVTRELPGQTPLTLVEEEHGISKEMSIRLLWVLLGRVNENFIAVIEKQLREAEHEHQLVDDALRLLPQDLNQCASKGINDLYCMRMQYERRLWIILQVAKRMAENLSAAINLISREEEHLDEAEDDDEGKSSIYIKEG